MRLPIWKRKPMIAKAVTKTALVSEESDRNDVFLRLMQQFERASLGRPGPRCWSGKANLEL